jgi:hypothetical protein
MNPMKVSFLMVLSWTDLGFYIKRYFGIFAEIKLVLLLGFLC